MAFFWSSLRRSGAIVGFLYVAVFVLIGLAYKDVFQNEYVWDDVALFVDSTSLRAGNISDAIIQPILPGTTYFRPLVLLSFSAEFNVFGVHPLVSHSINLIIHLVNVLLVLLIARFMTRELNSSARNILALSAICIFGLHPVLTESVAWVAGRFDGLVSFFVLLASYLTLRLNGFYRWVFIPLVFFLAALCKEMAMTFPLVWFAMILIRESIDGAIARQIWPLLNKYKVELLLVILAGSLYLLLRAEYLSNLYHVDGSVEYYFVGIDRLFLILNTLYFYVQQLFFPFADLSPMHPLEEQLKYTSIFFGAVVVVLCLYGAYILLFQKMILGALLFLVTVLSLAPVLNIIPLTIGGNIGHERFLTLPCAFFALAIMMFLKGVILRGRSKSNVAIVALSCWCLISFANVLLTVPLWKSNLTLWAWAYAKHKEIPYVQASYISSLVRAGYIDLAQAVLDDSKLQFGEEFESHRWLVLQEGYLLARQKKYQEAINTIEGLETRIPLPHKSFIKEKGSLDGIKANFSNFDYVWVLRGMYSILAESYLALMEFEKSYEISTYALFYQHDYAPSLLLKALSEIGLGRDEQAKLTYRMVLDNALPEARKDFDFVLVQFINQYCERRKDALPCVDKEGYFKEIGAGNN